MMQTVSNVKSQVIRDQYPYEPYISPYVTYASPLYNGEYDWLASAHIALSQHMMRGNEPHKYQAMGMQASVP